MIMNHEPPAVNSYVPSLPGSITLSLKTTSVLHEYVEKIIDAGLESTYEPKDD